MYRVADDPQIHIARKLIAAGVSSKQAAELSGMKYNQSFMRETRDFLPKQKLRSEAERYAFIFAAYLDELEASFDSQIYKLLETVLEIPPLFWDAQKKIWNIQITEIHPPATALWRIGLCVFGFSPNSFVAYARALDTGLLPYPTSILGLHESVASFHTIMLRTLLAPFLRPNTMSPVEQFREWLAEAIRFDQAHLSEENIQRRVNILFFRFGLNELEPRPHSLLETATRFQTTRERIRQIESRIFRTLRKRESWPAFVRQLWRVDQPNHLFFD